MQKAGAWNGNRTRTPAMNEAADFKSAVSTYFTIQAQGIETGGAARSRTGLAGFAIRMRIKNPK